MGPPRRDSWFPPFRRKREMVGQPLWGYFKIQPNSRASVGIARMPQDAKTGGQPAHGVIGKRSPVRLEIKSF